MEIKVALFLLEFAAGLAVYRARIALWIGKLPTTRCDYCQWFLIRGKEPFRTENKRFKRK